MAASARRHGDASRSSRAALPSRAHKEPRQAARDEDVSDSFHRIRQQHLLQLSRDAPRVADASWAHVMAVRVAVAAVHAAERDACDADWREWGADVEGVIESTLRCPICLSAPVAPRMLPCGHVYCFACLFQVVTDDAARTGSRCAALHDLARQLVCTDVSGAVAAEAARILVRCPVCADSVNACDSRPVRFHSPLIRRAVRVGDATTSLLPACAYPALLARAHGATCGVTAHPVPTGGWASAAAAVHVPVCTHMGAPTHVYSIPKGEPSILSRFLLTAVHVSSLTPGHTHLPEFMPAPAELPSGVRIEPCVHARGAARVREAVQLRASTAAALRAASAEHRDEEEHSSAAVAHAIRDSTTPMTRSESAPSSPPLASVTARPSAGWSRTHTHALIRAHTPVVVAPPVTTSSIAPPSGVSLSAATESIGRFSDATAHARACALACDIAAACIEEATPAVPVSHTTSCDCTRVLVYACDCCCVALDAHAVSAIAAAATSDDGVLDAHKLPLVVLAPVVASAPMRTRALTHEHVYTAECDTRRVLAPDGGLVAVNTVRAGVLDCSRARARVRTQLCALPREGKRGGADAAHDTRARTQSDVLREFMGIHSELDASSLRLCVDAGDVSDLAAFPAMSASSTPHTAASTVSAQHHTHAGWRYKDVVHAPLGYTPALSAARSGPKLMRSATAPSSHAPSADVSSATDVGDGVLSTSPPTHMLDLSAMLRAAPAGRSAKQKHKGGKR